MGQMKKIAELVDKYNKLRGREKEAVRESMEALKRAVGYKYEHDQLNEIDPPVISIFKKDNGILDGYPANELEQ